MTMAMIPPTMAKPPMTHGSVTAKRRALTNRMMPKMMLSAPYGLFAPGRQVLFRDARRPLQRTGQKTDCPHREIHFFLALLLYTGEVAYQPRRQHLTKDGPSAYTGSTSAIQPGDVSQQYSDGLSRPVFHAPVVVFPDFMGRRRRL